MGINAWRKNVLAGSPATALLSSAIVSSISGSTKTGKLVDWSSNGDEFPFSTTSFMANVYNQYMIPFERRWSAKDVSSTILTRSPLASGVTVDIVFDDMGFNQASKSYVLIYSGSTNTDLIKISASNAPFENAEVRVETKVSGVDYSSVIPASAITEMAKSNIGRKLVTIVIPAGGGTQTPKAYFNGVEYTMTGSVSIPNIVSEKSEHFLVSEAWFSSAQSAGTIATRHTSFSSSDGVLAFKPSTQKIQYGAFYELITSFDGDIYETFGVSSTMDTISSLVANSTDTFTAVSTSMVSFIGNIIETLSVSDSLSVETVLGALAYSSAAFSDAGQQTLSYLGNAEETASFQGTMNAGTFYADSVVDNATISSESISDISTFISEFIEFVTTTSAGYSFVEGLIELFSTSSSADTGNLFVVDVESVFSASSSTETSASFSAFLVDMFSTMILVDVAGQKFFGYVVNRNTGAASRYEDFGFNSFMVKDGRYYGLKGDGIYLIDGSDDAGVPIQSRITTGLMDFGYKLQKRLPDAYVAMSNEGKVFLSVKVDGGDGAYIYECQSVGEMRETRIKLGKGLKSSMFRLELSSEEAFDVESMHVYPVVLTRHVK